jgi:hypothetical protein
MSEKLKNKCFLVFTILTSAVNFGKLPTGLLFLAADPVIGSLGGGAPPSPPFHPRWSVSSWPVSYSDLGVRESVARKRILFFRNYSAFTQHMCRSFYLQKKRHESQGISYIRRFHSLLADEFTRLGVGESRVISLVWLQSVTRITSCCRFILCCCFSSGRTSKTWKSRKGKSWSL